jgi:hypothetical protein
VPSLLTLAQKRQLNAVFDQIHDTFARDIVIFKQGESSLIAIDLDSNYLYDRKKDSKSTIETLEKYTTKARIKYFGEHEKNAVVGGEKDPRITFPNADIRLKVDESAYNLITSSKRIEVDDQLYTLVSDPARTGPFFSSYYVIYLKRVN